MDIISNFLYLSFFDNKFFFLNFKQLDTSKTALQAYEK